ncbi:DoxX family protein [Nocardia otitidiscaviarum]|uniref:DoxX family protein n=1 Tax=Nocardia otitidiscaviarum TaxID=1823 RepID=A0A516NP78_9NOCA|nr:DoxX family protein [Nocardia otitidiscaviarum]MCP9624038.1 DoxX family protein [Nocardia otitidiscaviarum]QDP80699.1 DoxX family protein [Nocardia otitidiscaviarum]
MSTAAIIVSVLAALAALVAAGADVIRTDWVAGNMARYGVPRGWLAGLAGVKALGGAGLLIGLAAHPLALAAAAGLTIYFVLALATVVRARAWSDVGYPLPFLALAAAALALHLT